MAPNTNANGLHTSAPASTTAFAQQCGLCGGLRSNGSLLASHAGIGDPMLWVCSDCQHKLARRIDDEGALGG